MKKVARWFGDII